MSVRVRPPAPATFVAFSPKTYNRLANPPVSHFKRLPDVDTLHSHIAPPDSFSPSEKATASRVFRCWVHPINWRRPTVLSSVTILD